MALTAVVGPHSFVVAHLEGVEQRGYVDVGVAVHPETREEKRARSFIKKNGGKKKEEKP